MRMKRLISPMVLCVAIAACATSPQPVPLVADQADLSSLTGEWDGEYSSVATGRAGSISFSLVAGHDTATGDVLMVPRGTDQPASDRQSGAQVMARAPQVLRISFVRVLGANVSGTIEPYRAPDCDCILSTTFVGQLRGDTVEGTFSTTGGQADSPQSGRWKVTRKKGGV
jgi:hypothetical protein